MAVPVSLSPRQAQVARLLDEGLTQVEVAERLDIAPRTVWYHVAAIRRKVGAKTTAAALSRVRARRAPLSPRSDTL